MLFYPERVALAGLLVYLGIWLVAPLNRVFPVSWGALGFIGLSYAAFFFGCFLVAIRNRPMRRPPYSRPPYRKDSASRAVAGGGHGALPIQFTLRSASHMFWIMAVLGLTGIALRVYDKFIIRGMDFSAGARIANEALSANVAGPVAALGGALYPFCYVPLIIWWAQPTGLRKSPALKWLAVLLFILPALIQLQVYSRSQMIVSMTMMYFSAACMLYRGNALHRRLLISLLAGLVLTSAISAFIFLARLNEMELDIVYSMQNSVYAYTLEPNEQILSFVSNSDRRLGALVSDVIPLIQYYLHGLLEFSLLWDRPSAFMPGDQIFTAGEQHFGPYLKLLSQFGVYSFPNFSLEDTLHFRSNVFSTFFGPLWVDFGWFGVLYIAAFGALCKYCSQLARRGNLAVMPLYAYFCVVLFFMPVDSFIVSAQGMYAINAFLLLWMFGRQGAHRRSTQNAVKAQEKAVRRTS